jgi:hypothetical protein
MYDNGGFQTSPHPNQGQPVITQTALQLTNGTADANAEATVVAGARYRFTSYKTGGFMFGLATTATVANIRWVCPLYATVEIQIPQGYTSLHYQTNVNSGVGYLVKIKQNADEDPAK